jgi:hypothetical protein
MRDIGFLASSSSSTAAARTLLVLRIENIGTTPAVEVRFEFDTPPRSSLGDIENLRLLREGIP